MTRSSNNIMAKRAPLNFDHRLRRRNCVLREENIQDSCPSTLHNSSDSWIASAQCFKGAELKPVLTSSKLLRKGVHVVCTEISFVTVQVKKIIKNVSMGHSLRSFHQWGPDNMGNEALLRFSVCKLIFETQREKFFVQTLNLFWILMESISHKWACKLLIFNAAMTKPWPNGLIVDGLPLLLVYLRFIREGKGSSASQLAIP